MPPELLTAFIAFAGVLISVAVSLFSVNRKLMLEKSKIDSDIELLYIGEINKRRLEAYPAIYEEISVFLRSLVREKATISDFEKFLEKISDLNTKHSLLFSYETGDKFNGVWKFYFKEYQGKIPEKSSLKMEKLIDCLSQLKISLKKEVGVYLLEFRDPQRKLNFNNYDEIRHLRNRKKGMKKKILLFEGIDGSGKTSLLNEVALKLEKKGVSYKIISREITPAATLISQGFIGLDIPPETEICLRLAREYINDKEIHKNKEDIFILDRSLITIRAIFKIHGLDETLYSPLLENLYDENLFSVGAIFCTLPFKIAQERVFKRIKSMGNTELKSIDDMKKHECDNNIYDALHIAWNSSNFSNRLEVNTDDFNLQECSAQVLDFINKM